MTDHWWLGTTSADPTVAANWSTAGSGGAPGISVPGTGDEVEFDSGGNNICTFTTNMTFLNFVVVVGYTAKLDLVTFNLDIENDIILDGGGEFDCGTGSHSVTNGTLDNKDQATFTRGASTWTLNGVCTMIGHSSNDYYNLTFASGSTVIIDASTTARLESRGICNINGAVVLNNRLTVSANGDFVINSGASFSGSSFLYLYLSNSGHGLITLDGSVATPLIQIFTSVPGTVLTPGTYAGLVKLFASVATNTILQLSNGIYNFNGGLELECTGSGSVTLDNSANNPTINVTDLTIDRDNGTIVINDSATAVTWTITGDVIDEAATDFTWTKGTGSVTLSGSANQSVDFMDQDPGQLIIDKSAGTMDLEAVDCELGAVDILDNFTITNSTIISNDDKNITGNVSFANAGNDITLGSETWTITGDLDLSNVGVWDGGTAVITASGGSAQSWDFDAKTIATIVVNKSAGTLTWTAAATMTTFTGTAGTFDPNGQTITITGDCTWLKAFDFDSAADALNGCDWVIGGDFVANGQTLKATAGWDLQVTGSANAYGAGAVAFCDATTTTINAFQGPFTDNGDNTNWIFAFVYQLNLGIEIDEQPLGPRPGILI